MQLIAIADVVIDERKQATRFLRGSGIEIGASHMPIEVDKECCSVRYVDRLNEGEIDDKFPELRESTLAPIDVICDVVADGLAPFESNTLDFVIASHLLEHVPNPLGFIKECHRVLRNGGYLYLGVPDKEYTFDKDRERTLLSHIVGEFEADVKTIDEAHLVDYIVNAAKEAIPADPEEKARLFDRELGRSFHVHVWTSEDMIELLRYLVEQAGLGFDLPEMFLPKGIKNEFICVLQKIETDTETATKRFNSSLGLLMAREASNQKLIELAQSAPIEEPPPDTPENGNGHRSLLTRVRGRIARLRTPAPTSVE